MAKLGVVAVELNVDHKQVGNMDIKPVIKHKKLRKPILTPILNPPSSNPIVDILISMAGIFMIIPAILCGLFTFFGAGFKMGMESAIRMYNELMDDTKKWAK